MEKIKCVKCNEVKGENEFYKDKQQKNGLNTRCRSCYNAYVRQWRKNNPGKVKEYNDRHKQTYNLEYHREYGKKYRSSNRPKYNKKIYDWYEGNTAAFVSTQLKYQSKIPPHVYSITYKDTVVYVGSSNMPLRRRNVHFSTINRPTNIGKINKLHSFLGYNKDDFKFHLVEQVDDITQLKTRESYYEYFHQASYNFKKIFGEIERTSEIIARVFGVAE